MQKRTTALEKEDIVKSYIDGSSTKELSDKYGISSVAILGLLKRRNIAIRPQTIVQRKYSINENYFDIIDTEDKAYFLGFLYADGCNYPEKNTVIITLAEKDVCILEKFKEFLQMNKPLRFQERFGNESDVYSLTIENKHISNQLIKLGVVKNKTFKITFPTWLKDKLYCHFIRGYFDGDGHIGIYKKDSRFSIVGTENFCNSIAQIFHEKLKITTYIRPRHEERKNNIRMLEISGNNQIVNALNYLYNNSTINLPRKYDTYNKIKELIFNIHNKPKKECSVCGKKHFGHGYCRNHYYEYCGGKEKRQERFLKTGK